MHELSLIRDVLCRVLEVSDQYGGLPVARVHLEIGAERNVVPELLDFAFKAACAGTRAETATLVWEKVATEVLCPNCECSYCPDDVFWECPQCGCFGGRLLHGDELLLRTVELAGEKGGDHAGSCD